MGGAQGSRVEKRLRQRQADDRPPQHPRSSSSRTADNNSTSTSTVNTSTRLLLVAATVAALAACCYVCNETTTSINNSTATAGSRATAHPEPERPPLTKADATETLARAQALLDRHEAAAAAQALAEALARLPGLATGQWVREAVMDMNLALATAHSQMQQPAAAAAALEAGQAAAQAPADRAALAFQLAKLHMGYPEVARGRGRSARAEAVALLHTSLAAQPSADAMHWLAHQLLRLPGSAAIDREALALLEQLVVRDGRRAGPRLGQLTESHPLDTLMLLGHARERRGLLAAAVHAYEQGTALMRGMTPETTPPEIKRRLAMCFFQQARLHLHLGAVAAAEEVALQALSVFPDSILLLDVAVAALWQGGQQDSARQLLRRATERGWGEEDSPMAERILGATMAHLVFGNSSGGASSGGRVALATEGAGEVGGGCVVPRVSARAVSVAEFRRRFVDTNLPVLVTDAMDEWPAIERWSFGGGLQQHYGKLEVLARAPAAVAYDMEFAGLEQQRMTLEAFLNTTTRTAAGVGAGAGEELPLYAFDSGLSAEVGQDYDEPALFRGPPFALDARERQARALFYVGAADTGTGLHEHTAAWNALVHGRKEWYLFPPHGYAGPLGMGMREWLAEGWWQRRGHGGCRAEQQAGEILFVPTNWLHGTVNTAPSVGIAVEIGHHKQLLKQLL